MKSLYLLALVLFVSAQSLSSADTLTKHEFKDGRTYFTHTNLNVIKSEISAVNFLKGEVLPLNTKVTIVSYSKKVMKFKVENKVYTYEYHDQADEHFDIHLSRMFGVEPVKLSELSLNDTDLKGIKDGKHHKGMTKGA